MDELDMTQRLAATLLAPPPPATESVARGRARLLAEATGPAGRSPRPRHSRRPAWIAVSACAAAAAVAAGAVIALRPAPDHHPAPAAQAVLTSALRQAILTAFSTASDDILREQWSVTMTKPHATVNTVLWNWPALPQQHQPAQWRASVTGQMEMEATGTFVRQPNCAPVALRLPRGVAPSTLTIVNETQKTWSRQLVRSPIVAPPVESPACLLSEIATGNIWYVSHVRWHGQAALKLTPIGEPHRPSLPSPAVLWLNARTYLPLAEQFTRSRGITLQDNFQMLPPTPANLSQLRVRIPAGFRRLPHYPHLGVLVEPWSAF